MTGCFMPAFQSIPSASGFVICRSISGNKGFVSGYCCFKRIARLISFGSKSKPQTWPSHSFSSFSNLYRTFFFSSRVQDAPCALLIQPFRSTSATQLYLSLRIVCIGWPYQHSQSARKPGHYLDARSRYLYNKVAHHRTSSMLFYKRLRTLLRKKTMQSP